MSERKVDKVDAMLKLIDETGAGSGAILTGGGDRDVFVLVAVDEEAHRWKAIYDEVSEADDA